MLRSRTGTPADWLVVGLGNPGPEYAHTRHNAGADVVALLAERHGGRLRLGKERALAAEVRIDGQRVALAFPQTYMNDSGVSVGLLRRRYGIESVDRIVVVHDELDLPVGRIKLKEGGGLAGHNGLKSIKAHLKDDGFLRVRIGIGKPPGKQEGVDHVLRKPSKAERTELEVTIEEAADAVEAIVVDGMAASMNRHNS
ncbi:MAG TPA: aminoacyl-tRNA hydrolase [Acidimicrobiales bacterium]|nr:aminoacyl-tRNA hydrolase [Acidimicrobiales bacterium]